MSLLDASLLTVESLCCRRGEHLLFKALSFSILPGEALQVTGSNGVGKSSLLRVIAGLLPFESGTLQVATEQFYLGHQLGLKKTLTVEENLRFDMRYPKPSKATICSLLQETVLSQCSGKPVLELSQGQQQRLALAKCLLSKAKLWLLDEPFAALDKDSCCLWKNYMVQHLQQGGAIIFSSHLALAFSDISLRQMELLSC